MPTTVEILLKSTFDSSGYDEARNKTKEISEKITGEFATGETVDAYARDMFPTQEGQEFADTMELSAEALRENARAAEELKDHDNSKKFINEANAAKRLASVYKDLSTLTESELIKNFTKTDQSLTEMAKEMDKAALTSKKLQAKMLALGKTAQAEALGKTAKNAENAAKKMRDLEKAISGANEEAEESQFAELFEDTSSVDQFKQKLKSAHKELEKTRDAAIAAGKETGTIASADKIADLEALDKRLFGVQGSFDHLGRRAEGLGKILTHPFNQLGFALFVTTSTLRNLTGIARQFFEVIQQGARSAELMDAVAIAAGRLGKKFEDVRDELTDSSKGYIKQNDLLKTFIRLSNVQNTEIANSGQLITDTAIALSKLVGDTTTANTILQEITDTLISGNAAQVESAQGYLDLSDAEIELKLASRDLGRELSNLEQQQIVFDVFVRKAQDVVDAAKDIEGGADNIAQFQTLTSGYLDTVKEDFTGVVDEVAGLILKMEELKAFDFGEGDTKFLESVLQMVPGLGVGLQQLEAISAAGGLEEFLIGVGEGARTLAEDWGFLISTIPGGDELLIGMEQLGLLGEIGTNTAEELELAANSIEKSLAPRPIEAFDFSEITDQFDWILGVERQFYIQRDQLADDAQERMGDLTDDHNERLLQMEQDKDDKIEAQFEKTQDRREKLTEKHKDRLLDIEEDYNDKILDIDDDLALREERTIEDADDKQADKKEKHNKKLQDIEEDHQKKIRDIMRKFELSRLKALIDRDARALFEAQQKRDTDLAKAQEDADEKREDENESFKETMADLEDNLEKRLRRLREDAQRRRDDAKDQFDEQRKDELDRYIQQDKDLKIAFKQQKKTIEDAWKKKRKAVIKQFNDQRKEIKLKYTEQKTDLENAYDEQELITETQAAQTTFIKNTELIQQATDLQTQLNLEKDIWAEYWNWVNTRGHGLYDQPTDTTGGGGGGDGGGGGGGGGGGDPDPQPNTHCNKRLIELATAGAGVDCNPALWEDKGLRATKGGIVYACIDTPVGGGRWRVVNDDCSIQMPTGTASVGSQSSLNTTAPSPGSAPLTGSLFSSGGQVIGGNGGGRIPVHLVVDNDQTLSEILKSISYEAFIEIME